MFFVLSRAWVKKRNLSSHEELQVEPWSSNALPLSHRDSVVRETYYEVPV